MKAVEIQNNIYWVGAIDWSMRSFHGYETSRGSSYNAYLILDEKVTLIDTVKEPFKEELLERIASVFDPAKIDYIISNHVEPDHSGSLPFMMAHCPNAKVITSVPNGLKGLTARYGDLPLSGRQAQTALKALKDLPIEMIATGHGIIWRSHVKEIHDLYEKWSTGVLEKRAVVVFDTMWHSTEQMARTITEAFQEEGVPATFYDIKENPLSDILTDILTSEYLAVGSPTINNQMMPTIASFLCYLKGLTAKGHKAFAFGSYGWGGQSIGLVEEELKAAGCDIVLDKQRLLNTPDENTLEALREAVHTII